MHRSELAALLWPGQPPALAAANLRKALHFARTLPWAAALQVERSAVRFAVATDLLAFQRARREGRCADALALHRGELLDGFDDPGNDAWSEALDAERALLRRHRHDTERVLLAELAAQPQQAAALARRMLDADALDEDAVVALLAAQRALGRFDEQRQTLRGYALRLADELGVEPSQRVTSQLREAAGGAAAADFSFVGRSREHDELAALLARDDVRLLTLTGPGGVGKSTLAKHAARTLAPRFADGTLWIALDDLDDPVQVLARLASELQLAPAPQPDLQRQVIERLRGEQRLLVLDNAEHLGPAIARLAERLLEAAPALKLLATSRVRLAAAHERLLVLHGLALPAQQPRGSDALDSDAARLFVAAAIAARPDFDAAAEAEPIAELLHATGGLPLAILLAAHWVRLLPVAEIVAELQRSLAVLDSGSEGDERPEHRSVQATFERSWQMLAAREQQALGALAVFSGGFTRDAALQVAGATLPLLAALADKSLLQMPPGGRCTLHPLIRRFAAGKRSAAASALAAQRHAEWCHAMLARLAAPDDESAAAQLIDAELKNCRVAWRWAIEQRASAMLAGSVLALMRYSELRNVAAEGLALLQRALPLADAAPPAHAAALYAATAHLQYRLYRLDDAAASAKRGIALARAAGRSAPLLRCLNVLGLCQWHWGRLADAQRILGQSLRHARAAGDARSIAIALGNLASVERAAGKYEPARLHMLEVLARQRELGDWTGVAVRLSNLAHLHQARLEWREAAGYLDAALEVTQQHGIVFVRPHVLVNRAITAFFVGDIDDAERIGRQALDEARGCGNRSVEGTALLHLVRVDCRRAAAACRRDGARADLRAALACADAMGNTALQLDAVFCFAEVLAAEGDTRRAASLMRWYAAEPDVEPGDRAIAEAALAALPAPGDETISMPRDALLAALRSELGAA